MFTIYRHRLQLKTKLKHYPVLRGIFGISGLFQNFYVFNPRFLAETLIIFCGTVVRTHWLTQQFCDAILLDWNWLGVLLHNKQKRQKRKVQRNEAPM